MTDRDPSDRRLKLTLVLRDDKDDPSILDIVRRAVEDGLRTPAIGSAASPSASPDPDTPHVSVGEDIEDRARDAVEKALADVIEQFQAAGKDPSFDPAQWAAQLSKVWAVVRRAKAAGVGLRVTPADDPPPPADAP